MRTTIELPDAVYRKGEQLALAQGVTVEELLIRTVVRELSIAHHTATLGDRVTLPLIRSKQPGTLDLRAFDFDDLLA